jgi:hypothetical protein
MRKNLITGFTAGVDEHSWILAIRDYLKPKPCAVYDGIGGDVLSAGVHIEKSVFLSYHILTYIVVENTGESSFGEAQVARTIHSTASAADLVTFVGIIARERRWRQRKPAGAP